VGLLVRQHRGPEGLRRGTTRKPGDRRWVADTAIGSITRDCGTYVFGQYQNPDRRSRNAGVERVDGGTSIKKAPGDPIPDLVHKSCVVTFPKDEVWKAIRHTKGILVPTLWRAPDAALRKPPR